jgi:hypothetical protein
MTGLRVVVLTSDCADGLRRLRPLDRAVGAGRAHMPTVLSRLQSLSIMSGRRRWGARRRRDVAEDCGIPKGGGGHVSAKRFCQETGSPAEGRIS